MGDGLMMKLCHISSHTKLWEIPFKSAQKNIKTFIGQNKLLQIT